MSGQRGFWDVDERYGLLSKAGDPLEGSVKYLSHFRFQATTPSVWFCSV